MPRYVPFKELEVVQDPNISLSRIRSVITRLVLLRKFCVPGSHTRVPCGQDLLRLGVKLGDLLPPKTVLLSGITVCSESLVIEDRVVLDPIGNFLLYFKGED